MSFDHQKRVLLCWLALLAPLPLPLNEPRPSGVIGWVYLALFELAVAICLRRALRSDERWLSNRALNLLGVVYLPFFAIDVARSGGQFVTPMMHLALFALAVKLYALRQERDKWHAVFGIFFVFVTAMATSASVGIILYLLVFLILWAMLLARFSQLHMATRSGQEGAPEVGESKLLARVVPLVALAAIVLSIPIFVALPRLRNPYIFGRGMGTGALDYAAGFSDEVSLDVIGRIRTNRDVALRARWQGAEPVEVRMRGATYGVYRSEEKRWIRLDERLHRATGRPDRYVLASGRVEGAVDIWLEPLGARSLVLPEDALAVDLEGTRMALVRSEGGTVSLTQVPNRTVSYRVETGVTDSIQPRPPPGRPELDLGGVTPSIADLARRVAGSGDPLQQARRIEEHLVGTYRYTLDFIGREGEQPLDEFLFVYRSGHCELFASAMVMMLRSIGTPARFVTGFLGAESSPLGYHIVRQGNAHAWVEAWIPGRGWAAFDPTPPAGRPAIEPRSALGLARQAYDWVVFAWDRYVISYGVGDQSRVFARLTALVQGLVDRLRGERQGEDPRVTEVEGPAAPGDRVEATRSRGFQPWWLALPLLLLVALLLLFRAPTPTARRAYQRLRRQARLRGVEVDDSVPPNVLRARLAERCPAASAPSGRLVDLYLAEAYAERSLSPEEQRELEGLLTEARRALRRAS